ncbi:MAG: SEC-C metal-binding domain-containing protein [Minisyncoccales bacterium]
MGKGINEFNSAFEEYFKDKPKPKNDEEDKKQLEEFTFWYNNVRKQSDTGKTPAEMYKEKYGEEPPEKPKKPSRMKNFEWDDDYDEELIGLIYDLQEYDNEEGNKRDHNEVRKKLKPVIDKIMNKGEKSLDWLYDLLENEETWSCLFALEILKEIKNKKSVPYLINFLLKSYEKNYDYACERAMFALTNIGEPSIKPLLTEIRNQFEEKKFNFYLVGALTAIKSEEVYNFMKEITEDYIKNEEKYGEWFHIDAFVHDFDKQGKKEIIPLLKSILKLDRTSKHEKIEIQSTIEMLENPEEYEKKLKEDIEKMKPLIESCSKKLKEFEQGDEEFDEEKLQERMYNPEEDLEIQFKCHDCQKKQNINPGLIKVLGDETPDFSFENELMCKFCFSNNIKPTKQGRRDIMLQSIGTFMGNRTGVVSAESEVCVENKQIKYKDSYKYILKRVKEEPENGRLYLRAGNVARNFNTHNEAIKHYKKAIKLNPKLIAVYFNLVEIYEHRFRYYNIKDAKENAKFYLNEMLDLFRTQDYYTDTLVNKEIIIPFMGEMSESLGLHVPELVKIPSGPKKSEKIGRNDPCPCGSGKKYKKCCLEV